jgi:ABC-type multidrug transport system ATPase subunit
MASMTYGGTKLAPEEDPAVLTDPAQMQQWRDTGTGIWDTPIASVYGKGQDSNFLMEFTNTIVSGMADPMLPSQAMAGIFKPCHPFSKGEVTIPGRFAHPSVDYNFFAEDRDMEHVLNCTEGMLKMFGLFQWRGMDLTGLHAMTRAELRNHIRKTAANSYHAFGTCRMGSGPMDVVDERLLVHGTENVRVVDGSIVPMGPCSGPMALVYAVGEKGAALIIEDAKNMKGGNVGGGGFGHHVVDHRGTFLGVAASFVLVMLVVSIAAVVRMRANSLSARVHVGEILAAHHAKMDAHEDENPHHSADDHHEKMVREQEAKAHLKSKDTKLMEQVDAELTEHFKESGAGLTMHWSDLRYCPPGRDSVLNEVAGRSEAGTTTMIMGSSGAGKTTMMKALACRQENGTITGHVLYDMPGRKQRFMQEQDGAINFVRENVAFVPQLPDTFHTHLTVLETAILNLMLREPRTWEESLPLCVSLHLEEASSVPVARLSGGQIKRLQIMTRLFGAPLALFADEPTSGLDHSTSLVIVQLLCGLKRYGITVVMTIHSPDELMLHTADNLYLMAPGGKFAYSGSFDALVPRVPRDKMEGFRGSVVDLVLGEAADAAHDNRYYTDVERWFEDLRPQPGLVHALATLTEGDEDHDSPILTTKQLKALHEDDITTLHVTSVLLAEFFGRLATHANFTMRGFKNGYA